MIRALIVCFVLSFIFLAACEQQRDPCLEPKSVPLRVIAKHAVNDTTFVDTLLPHPIWRAVDSPFNLAFPKKSSAFSLLLSPLADSCRYALQPDSALASFDTITFYYDRDLKFLSNACGFTYFYSLNQVRSSRNHIDSLKIINAEVNQNASSPEHVQIFF